MEIGQLSYREAIEQLQAMFHTCDKSTISSVLSANDGNIEKTIEDLLKITSEVEHNEPEDDNLFAEPGPTQKPNTNRNDDLFGIDDEPHGKRFEDLGIFQDSNTKQEDERLAKEMQEKADAELAYRLQTKYLQQEDNQLHQAAERLNQQHLNDIDTGAGYWEFSQEDRSDQDQPRKHLQEVKVPNGDKKKPGLMNKVKMGISNMFNKKKDPVKNKVSQKNKTTEAVVENENLDDQEVVYNFSTTGPTQVNMGIHQLDRASDRKSHEDAPVHLADILNPRGLAHMTDENSDDENYLGNKNNRNETGIINQSHFNFS